MKAWDRGDPLRRKMQKEEKRHICGGQRVRKKTGICAAEGMCKRKTKALLLDLVTRSLRKQSIHRLHYLLLRNVR